MLLINLLINNCLNLTFFRFFSSTEFTNDILYCNLCNPKTPSPHNLCMYSICQRLLLLMCLCQYALRHLFCFLLFQLQEYTSPERLIKWVCGHQTQLRCSLMMSMCPARTSLGRKAWALPTRCFSSRKRGSGQWPIVSELYLIAFIFYLFFLYPRPYPDIRHHISQISSFYPLLILTTSRSSLTEFTGNCVVQFIISFSDSVFKEQGVEVTQFKPLIFF